MEQKTLLMIRTVVAVITIASVIIFSGANALSSLERTTHINQVVVTLGGVLKSCSVDFAKDNICGTAPFNPTLLRSSWDLFSEQGETVSITAKSITDWSESGGIYTKYFGFNDDDGYKVIVSGTSLKSVFRVVWFAPVSNIDSAQNTEYINGKPSGANQNPEIERNPSSDEKLQVTPTPEKVRPDLLKKSQLALNEIALQAIMIDDVIAIPVKNVATLEDVMVKNDLVSLNCIYIVSKDSYDDKSRKICDETAWGTSNFVSKIVSGRMYSPLIAINETFDTVFNHDKKNRRLTLLIEYESKNVELHASLPKKLPLIKTKTRAQIFPYTKDSVPKCSTSTLKRNAYTLSLTGSRPYKSIDLNLKNTSNSTIVVIWDETSLRLPDGSSSGVIHSGTRFSDRSLGQANTPVSPRALLQDLLVAKTSIKYSESLTDWVFDLFSISVIFNETRNSLFVRGSTQTVSGSIALQVNGKRVFEQFSVTCKAKTGEFRA